MMNVGCRSIHSTSEFGKGEQLFATKLVKRDAILQMGNQGMQQGHHGNTSFHHCSSAFSQPSGPV